MIEDDKIFDIICSMDVGTNIDVEYCGTVSINWLCWTRIQEIILEFFDSIDINGPIIVDDWCVKQFFIRIQR